jgi:hypothetical protein
LDFSLISLAIQAKATDDASYGGATEAITTRFAAVCAIAGAARPAATLALPIRTALRLG